MVLIKLRYLHKINHFVVYELQVSDNIDKLQTCEDHERSWTPVIHNSNQNWVQTLAVEVDQELVDDDEIGRMKQIDRNGWM